MNAFLLGTGVLVGGFFPFSTLNISSYCLQTSMGFVDLFGLLLHMMSYFSLDAFKIFFLSLDFGGFYYHLSQSESIYVFPTGSSLSFSDV